MRLCGPLLCYAACTLAFNHPHFSPPSRLSEGSSRSGSLKRCSLLHAGGGVGKLPPRKRRDGVGVPCSSGKAKSTTAQPKDGFGKGTKKKGAIVQKKKEERVSSPNTNMIAVTSALQQSTAAVVQTVANTNAAHALLTPLHKWSTSRRRVAEAVEAENRSAATEKAKEQRQRSNDARISLLQQALPQPLADTYNALVSAAAVPGKLAESVGQTAEQLAAAPGKMKKLAEDVAAAGEATVESVASVPDQAREAVRAVRELPAWAEQALADGAKTYESWRVAAEALPEESKRLVDAAALALAKASEAVESLPSRLPDLIYNVADDAQLFASDLAKGTVEGVDAASSALRGVVVEAGSSATERLLRQALAPVHDYWTSVMRVQAAVDEEQAALPPPPRSATVGAKAEGAATTVATAMELQQTGRLPLGGEASQGASRKSAVWRPGLREKFSAWRRKRKSIAAVLVTDEDDSDNRSTGTDSGDAVLEPMISSQAVVETVQGRTATAPAALEGVDGGLAVEAGEQEGPEPVAVFTRSSRGGVDDGEGDTGGRVPASVAVTNGAAEESPREPIFAAGSSTLTNLSLEEQTTKQGSENGSFPALLVDTQVSAAFLPPVADGVKQIGASIREEDSALVAGNDRVNSTLDGSAVTGENVSRAAEVELAPAGGLSQAALSVWPPSGDASAVTDRKPAGTEHVDSSGDPSYSAEAEVAQSSAVAEVREELLSLDASAGGASTLSSGSSSEAAVVAPFSGGVGDAVPLDGQNGDARPTVELLSPKGDPAAAVSVAQASVGGATGTTPAEGKFTSEATARSSGTTEVSAVDTTTAAVTLAETTLDTSAVSFPPGAATVEKLVAVAPKGEADGVLVSAPSSPVAAASTLPAPRLPNAVGSEEGVTAAIGTTKAAEPFGAPGVNDSLVPTGSVGDDDAGDLEDSSGWGVMSPAAEFLKEWVENALPRRKAQLKQKDEAFCWERQWYPVAIVSELPQRWLGDGTIVRFQMLGREYELLPSLPYGGSPGRTSADSVWSCRAVSPAQGRPESALEPTIKLPVRESSGLLWTWPDTSPEGLAAAAHMNPAPLPQFSRDPTAGDREDGAAVVPWRRLLRRKRVARGGDDGGGGMGGGREGVQETTCRRRYDVVGREVSCGYADAVGGLLAPKHGAAVRAAAAAAAAAGRNGKAEEATLAELRAAIDARLTSPSSSGFQAAFNASSGPGEVSFTSPTVVEWRFSPPLAEQATPQGDEARNEDAGRRPRRWLLRRLTGFGGSGGGDLDNHRAAALKKSPERSGSGGGRSMRYVAVVLPVGPGCTKIFARLEVELPGHLDGRSMWWSRRIRRALLTKAVDDTCADPSK